MKTSLRLALASASLLCLAAAEPNPVHMNQLGFLPDGAKKAMVADPSAAPLPWRLLDGSGKVSGQGLTTIFGADAASGTHVHRIDLTNAVRAPGSNYRLIVGDRQSRAFAVAADIYDGLQYGAFNYFYQNRAGTPIDARWAGGATWARPAGHLPEKAGCVSGKDGRGNAWPGCPYTLDVTGGWYDAGDQGKYIVNGGITLWTLLNLHERQAGIGRPTAFDDGKAQVPEAGNGVSDLLDEARWELEFFLKMQVPEGTRLRLPVGVKRAAPGLAFSEIDASGMVHHKVADEKWTALPTPPHLDREKRQLFPPSTSATLNFAAVTAQCARIWRTIDAAFASRCLSAAEKAWTAARRNPEIYPIADFTGSGGYGDGELADEVYWAAAELFATTGKADYETAVRASPHLRAARLQEPNWGSVAPLGTLTLLTVPNRLAQTDLAALKASLVASADAFLADRAKNGYAIPYAPERGYPWGSTSSVLNRAIILARAHDLTGNQAYRDGVVDAIDYILGRNPLDRSFVSGFGARPMENPHHRYWARQLDASMPPTPPGALSGGPNSTSMGDPVAGPMRGKCAPQMCWADDARSYTMNEVAINWNAPLVWVSAWLAERR